MAKSFGERLKELRLEKNLKQSELAKEFNTGTSSISSYEKYGRLPDVYTITKYAKFFGVSLDYIIGKSDSRNPKDEDNKLAGAENLTIEEMKLKYSESELLEAKIFSERLRYLMLTRDITVDSISKKLKIDKNKLIEYVMGSEVPTLELLKKIAVELDTTTDYLLGVVDEIKKPKSNKKYDPDLLLPDYIEVAVSAQDKKISPKVLSDFIKQCLKRGEDS